MTNEGDRPRSSWQSWVRSSGTRRTAPAEQPDAPTTPPPPTDLDVELEWSSESAAGAAATAAAASSPEPAPVGDGLDVGLSWGPDEGGDATVEHPVAEAPEPADEAEEDDPEVVDEEEYAPADVEDDIEDDVADEAEEDDDDDDAGELLPAVPLLPSIAGRVEALSGLLRSISMRVDGLTAVTDVYRANVTDRIDEYTETVLQLSRQSDQALDEHRRGTERAIGELRRTASDRGDAVGQLVARVEELATEMTTLREMVEVLIDTMPASADGSAGGGLTRADLDEAVDGIADAVVARIDTGAIVSAVVARMEQAFEIVSEPPHPAPAPAPRPRPAAPSVEDLWSDDVPAAPAEPPRRRGGGRISRGK